MVLGAKLWAKACDLKRQGMFNKKTKLALGNTITDRSIQRVWQQSRGRLQPLCLSGKFDPKQDWPTAEAILVNHLHFFCADQKKEKLAQIALHARLENKHLPLRRSQQAIKTEEHNRHNEGETPSCPLSSSHGCL